MLHIDIKYIIKYPNKQSLGRKGVGTAFPRVHTEKITDFFIAEYRRVCYVNNWSQYRPSAAAFFPEQTDPSLCTHMMFAYAVLQTNNTITSRESNDDVPGGLYVYFSSSLVVNKRLYTMYLMPKFSSITARCTTCTLAAYLSADTLPYYCDGFPVGPSLLLFLPL